MLERHPIGYCRFNPPQPFLFLLPPAVHGAAAQEITKSAYPPQHVDRWCGQHPDFMRWWMEHRDEFSQTREIREAEVEGTA